MFQNPQVVNTWKLSPNIQETIENIKAAKKSSQGFRTFHNFKENRMKSAPILHKLKLHSAGAALLPMQKSENAFEKLDPYFN